jgi:hypothetical protein
VIQHSNKLERLEINLTYFRSNFPCISTRMAGEGLVAVSSNSPESFDGNRCQRFENSITAKPTVSVLQQKLSEYFFLLSLLPDMPSSTVQ